MRNFKAHEIAAVFFLQVIEVHFTLDGDDIGHHAAAGFQMLPGGFENPGNADATADEHRIGAGLALQGIGRIACNDFQTRRSQLIGVGRNHFQSVFMLFKGQGFTAPCRAHPFDGHGAATGAHIPEQLIGGRGQGG